MNTQEIIKPAAALLAITVVASALLGFVHEITLEPIENQRIANETNAIKTVFPSTSDVEDVPFTAPNSSSVTRAAEVKSGEEIIGYAVYANPSGYGGPIEMMVGLYPNGSIAGIQILSHQETPGLGANAANPAFLTPFTDANFELKVTKKAPADSNEIQAITSATITSTAVVRGANDARQVWGAIAGGSQ
ncbi:MAG: RnfABCDGE type electron transport complex subunit G [Clostridiales bacterium]|jgi:electron transport complex protein RnfG|nr:RnfABCDGE type electron transport complex subunit G [Clostridiales bacterium]